MAGFLHLPFELFDLECSVHTLLRAIPSIVDDTVYTRRPVTSHLQYVRSDRIRSAEAFSVHSRLSLLGGERQYRESVALDKLVRDFLIVELVSTELSLEAVESALNFHVVDSGCLTDCPLDTVAYNLAFRMGVIKYEAHIVTLPSFASEIIRASSSLSSMPTRLSQLTSVSRICSSVNTLF